MTNEEHPDTRRELAEQRQRELVEEERAQKECDRQLAKITDPNERRLFRERGLHRAETRR